MTVARIGRSAAGPHRAAFGRRVRQLRVEQGLSQEKLAEVAGLHRTYIGSLERGERNVSLDQIYRLAAGLKIAVAELFPQGERDQAAPTFRYSAGKE